MLHYGRFMRGFLLVTSKVVVLGKQMVYRGEADGLLGTDR